MESNSVWVSAVAMENTLAQMMSTDRTDAVWPAIMKARMPSANDLPTMAWEQHDVMTLEQVGSPANAVGLLYVGNGHG
jgi:hypothetical protein